MRSTRPPVASTLRLGALAAALLVTACDKHPTSPGASAPLASLATIWPNADSTGWSYRETAGTWTSGGGAVVFPARDQVPPAPDVARVPALLAALSSGGFLAPDSGTYTIRFLGLVTTHSGVTAQALVESFGPPVPLAGAHGASDARTDPLLARLWRARPDLRARLAARLGAGAAERERGAARLGPAGGTSIAWVSEPLFLYGYAWRKTDEQIVGYGDIDTLPAWKYLDANLRPQARFAFQLVPSLASDVWLHGAVISEAGVTTPYGAFPKAVQVAYVVDYGISALTDPEGDLLGYSRGVSLGVVSYVDGVGPVAELECGGSAQAGGDVGSLSGARQLALTGRLGPTPSTAPARR